MRTVTVTSDFLLGSLSVSPMDTVFPFACACNGDLPPACTLTSSSEIRSPVVTNTLPLRRFSITSSYFFSAFTYVFEYSPGQKSLPPSRQLTCESDVAVIHQCLPSPNIESHKPPTIADIWSNPPIV